MEIRRARAEELPAVGQLLVDVYIGGGFIAADDVYVSELSDVSARAAGAEVLVAAEDGVLLGSVTWCPEGSAYREIGRPDEGEFRTLVVSPDARGRGIGEALVRHCLDLSYAAAHRGMVLSTLPTMVDAHRLYVRLGFARDPERDWSPHPAENLWAFSMRY